MRHCSAVTGILSLYSSPSAQPAGTQTTAILALALYLTTTAALAVPSFARQTGMACGACHTIYPKLTAFGRDFKLSGYTMANTKQIEGTGTDKHLKINEIPPLSAMLQVGFTHLNKEIPDQQNNNVEFPQALSLYYAGEISPHMGTFLQVTYSQPDDNFSFDMADIRYAKRTTLGSRDMLYGVTLNNAPGMEDAWNTTPAWTFPYTASDTAPGPAASPLVNNFMNVAGLGGYALWDDHWYGAVTFYRSAPLGQGAPSSAGSVSNVAPYARFAWQGYFSNRAYLEIGTYALYADFLQGMMAAGTAGQYDKYTDLALDATYQLPLNNNRLLSMHAIYIHENQTLDSSFAAGLSSNRNNTLEQFRADANYEFGHDGQITLGYFKTWGDSDPILYRDSTEAVNNSASGSPNSAAFLAEVDYLPWENTKFSLQYTAYTRFNGGNKNYNGAGRNASDNNTLYLNSWFMW
ncbi:hypothetical protein BMS3Abin11_01866 [bacterium BMS3Abin11]|nr:hypothetical protein BMS3Abin11_01866 [bacterium BMS3Abin11]